jgi:hypothetical protein
MILLLKVFLKFFIIFCEICEKFDCFSSGPLRLILSHILILFQLEFYSFCFVCFEASKCKDDLDANDENDDFIETAIRHEAESRTIKNLQKDLQHQQHLQQQQQQQQQQQHQQQQHLQQLHHMQQQHEHEQSQPSNAKKPRLVFTEIQRRTLQAIFKETKRPSKEMQMTIAQQLGLEVATVSNFFMNARRRSMDKWKEQDQDHEEMSNCSSLD